MKRKLLIIFLSIVTVVCLAFGISACGSNSETTITPTSSTQSSSSGNSSSQSGESSGEEVHVHDLQAVEAVEATCTEDGNTAYWYCEDCGKYYSDANATTEISKSGTVVAAKGHTLTNVEAVAATCGTGGNIAYWYCEDCGKYYSDANATTEITLADTVEAATEKHTYEGSWECTVCGNQLTASEGLEFTLSSDGESYKVSGLGTCTDLDIVVPYTYEELPVTSIGFAFENCASIKCIMIPDSVESLSRGCLKGCSSLESITIPYVGGSPDATTASASTLFGYIFGSSSYSGGVATKQYYYNTTYPLNGKYETYYIPENLTSVTISGGSLFEGAFYGCSAITDITIGRNVTSFGTAVFSGCSSLVNIYYQGTASEWASISFDAAISADNFYFNGTLATDITIEGITKINNYAFRGFNIVSVTIGEGVTSIGNYAFYNCSSLNSVTMSDVTSIGNYAFYSCSSLNSVTMSEVKTIGKYAFSKCISLTSITISESTTSIGTEAFKDCYKLIEVCNLSALNLTEGSSDYGYIAYYAMNICTSVSDSRLLTKDNYVFILDDSDNYCLVGYTGTDTKLVLPELTINGSAVNYSIYQYAFYNCNSLEITIPECVTSIGDYAFYICDSLASITISDSVTSIGTSAFYSCKSLESITITGGVTSIGENAFRLCTSLENLTISDSVTDIGKNAFYDCTSLTTVYYSGTASQWACISFENGMSNPFYYATNLYLNGTLATDITIEDITSINDYAFEYYSSLISVTIGDSVESIGYNAFNHCSSLESVTIGDNVTSIGNYAFYDCTSLESVTIGDNVTSIGNYAFYDCTSLASVTIGDNVTSIGNYAFYDCTSLTSVTIPNSVISIGSNAFYNCTSITNVYYYGTEEEWNAILTYSSNSCLTSATINYIEKEPETEDPETEDPETEDPEETQTEYNNVLYSGTQMINVVDTTAEIVVVKDDTTSIAENAFANCTNLRVVYIPSSVTEIGDNAFVCGADSELIIYFGASSSSSLFNNYTSWLGTYSYTYTYNGTEVSADIYYSYDTGITLTDDYLHTSSTVYGYIGTETVISIPSTLNSKTITTVGYSATVRVTNDVTYVRPLSSFIGVTSITMPSTITKVDSYAFYNNTTLESVTFLSDSGSLLVNSCAFYGCTNLSSVTFTEGAKLQLQSQSFYGCTSLKSIVIPSTAYIINANAFAGAGLTSITLTGFTYATLLDSDATSQGSLTLSDYTAAQLAAYITGDYAAYNWYLFSF